MLLAAAAHCALHTPPTAAGALAAERHWVAALERRDAAALDCLLGDGFTDINWQGKLVTRAEMFAGFDTKPKVTLTLDQLTEAARPAGSPPRRLAIVSDVAGEPAALVRADWLLVYRRSAYWSEDVAALIDGRRPAAERSRQGVWLSRLYRLGPRTARPAFNADDREIPFRTN